MNTISYQLATANTPGKKAAVTRKINAILEHAKNCGKSDRQVRQIAAGFKAAATRLSATLS